MKKSGKFRTKEEVISDLKKLVRSKGYIYSLCLILFEDFHHNLDKIHQVDYRSKLSVKECSLIIGFLVQDEIDFNIPSSATDVLNLKEKTYELMSELHFSLSSPQFEKIKTAMETPGSGERLTGELDNRLDFFAKDGGMVEPMFYAGDGVYDFQYLEYLGHKYKYDRDWLLKNRNFDLEKVCDIVKEIKSKLQEKAKKVDLIELKALLSRVSKRTKRNLKKRYSESEIKQLERQNFVTATFYQYRRLFPIARNPGGGNANYWKVFYENLLDLFIITESDLNANQNSKFFFEHFSFTPKCNSEYQGPGYFNILNARPLIRLAEGRYFAPINFLIPEAIYESPFYWMWDDESYRGKLSKHRGEVGEEIAYEFLSSVFGKEHTYRSVLVTKKKGEPETDIDVLCLLGNKALCVQIKSKKLTLSARRGDFEQLTKDFKGAVQDAYDQGIVSRTNILSKKASLQDTNGKSIDLEGIDEVYLMGLTTENYPSLVHQVHAMLVKEDTDPFPLFLSIFDLELLVHYLPDPYDFLYYVRQRITLLDYFRGEEELVYLGYHLDKKLWKMDGYDWVMIDNDFGSIIDRNYYPYKIGVSHLLSERNDPLHNRWKDLQFDEFSRLVKASNHSKTTDIIFHLLDWSGESRKGIVEQMTKAKSSSRLECTTKSIATAAPGFGMSYVALRTRNFQELEDKVEIYSVLRKYKSKSNAWLGIGSFSHSQNLVDCFIYLDDPWEFDSDLETQCAIFFNHKRPKAFISLGGNKIRRNDSCPCQSGLKYKKCCGL